MSKKEVLLICGTGASSGFMAANARKAAKKMGKDISFKARSDSTLLDYIEEIDLLLVGPHLKYMLDELKDVAEEYNVPVAIIEQKVYGTLDGEGLVQQVINVLESSEK